jgi:hypothetical protein
MGTPGQTPQLNTPAGTTPTTAPAPGTTPAPPANLAIVPVAPAPILMSGSHFTHLIPPLTANIGEWATKVRRVLEQKDIDFNCPIVAKTYVPFVMKNLPAYMLSSFKKKITLHEALEFLEKFDNRGGDLSERLVRNKLMSDKPSLTYLMLIDEMQKKMPNMDLAHLKLVACKDLKNGFPSVMRIYLPTFHIVDYPNEAQLKELDDSWEEFELSNPDTAVRVSSVTEHIPANNLILDRLQDLESAMRQDMSNLRMQVNAVGTLPAPNRPPPITNSANGNRPNYPQNTNYPRNNYPQNSGNNYPQNSGNNYQQNTGNNYQNRGNNSRSFAPQNAQNSGNGNQPGRRITRKEQYDNRTDKRYCYYHFHFGKDANKCDMPECPMKNIIAPLPGRVAR